MPKKVAKKTTRKTSKKKSVKKKDHKVFENNSVAMVKAKHGYFLYLTHDQFVGKSLEMYGEWTEPELGLLGSVISPGDIVIDAGAYIGTHSVFFAQKVGQSGMVYAIEPQRLAFTFLCANAALNELHNIVPLRKFASDREGYIRVPYLNPLADQNFGALHIGGMEQGEPTEIMTIDSLHLHACRLIKVDVEGAERRVLLGAKKTIKRCKPILYVENNTTERSKEIIETIDELGYQAYWHMLDYYQPTNHFKNKENIFEKFMPEVNMLCVPKEASIDAQGFIRVEGPDDNWKKAMKKHLDLSRKV